MIGTLYRQGERLARGVRQALRTSLGSRTHFTLAGRPCALLYGTRDAARHAVAAVPHAVPAGTRQARRAGAFVHRQLFARRRRHRPDDRGGGWCARGLSPCAGRRRRAITSSARASSRCIGASTDATGPSISLSEKHGNLGTIPVDRSSLHGKGQRLCHDPAARRRAVRRRHGARRDARVWAPRHPDCTCIQTRRSTSAIRAGTGPCWRQAPRSPSRRAPRPVLRDALERSGLERAFLCACSDDWNRAVADLAELSDDPRFLSVVPTPRRARSAAGQGPSRRAAAGTGSADAVDAARPRRSADVADLPQSSETFYFLKPTDSQQFPAHFGTKGMRVPTAEEARAATATRSSPQA